MAEEYTPNFRHEPWVDNVDRLQAETFNQRFAAIEAEFLKVAAKLQELEAILNSNTHDGDLRVTGNLTVDKSVGIGTPNHSRPLIIRARGNTQELISFEDPGGATKWHINQNVEGNKPGLNFGESGINNGEGRLFLRAGGRDVGLGTTNPREPLQIFDKDKGAICDDGLTWKDLSEQENSSNNS